MKNIKMIINISFYFHCKMFFNFFLFCLVKLQNTIIFQIDYVALICLNAFQVASATLIFFLSCRTRVTEKVTVCPKELKLHQSFVIHCQSSLWKDIQDINLQCTTTWITNLTIANTNKSIFLMKSTTASRLVIVKSQLVWNWKKNLHRTDAISLKNCTLILLVLEIHSKSFKDFW